MRNVIIYTLDQTGSGVHPASYPMGTKGCFPCDKETRSWSWPLTSI